MSERQQLAEAIRVVMLEPNEDGSTRRWYDAIDVLETRIAAAVEPFLVAAERAGYERCKRDATTGIEAAIAETAEVSDCPTCCGEWRDEFRDLLAVVAALNATQQEHDDVPLAPRDVSRSMHFKAQRVSPSHEDAT